MIRTIIVKNKDGMIGHINSFHDEVINPKKEYYARFKHGGETSSYSGRIYKGSELEFIRSNK